jgi:hypothetical protein
MGGRKGVVVEALRVFVNARRALYSRDQKRVVNAAALSQKYVYRGHCIEFL